MKKYISILIILISFTSCAPPYYTVKVKYCGLVIEKFCSESQGKYPSTEPHIVIDCVTSKRKVVAEVGWNEYVNTNVGDYKCYELSQNEIDNY